MSAGDLEEAMRRFQQEFAQQLPGRLQEARQLLAACRAAPADDERLRDLHRCMHKIAGSAGTFGMMEVSQRARVIEEQIEALSTQDQRDAAAFDRLAASIEALA